MQEVICEVTSGKMGKYWGGGFLGDEECAFILFLRSNEKWSVFQGILEVLMDFVNLVWNQAWHVWLLAPVL